MHTFQVRFCGSNMSPNGVSLVVEPDTVLISMKKFDKILEINENEKIVTVEAGVNLEYLLKELEKNGLALASHPVVTGKK